MRTPRKALASLALLACVRHAPTPRARPPRDAAVVTVTAPDAALDAAPADALAAASSLDGVVSAVRLADFAAAREALDRLPSAAQSTREGRYLRARIALTQDRCDEALPLLAPLAAELPFLRTDLLRAEARCLSSLGRHPESRAAYEALGDRARAAVEALSAGDTSAAYTVMRAWVADPPSSLGRARAWSLAAQVADASYDNTLAIAARRRLAVDEPDTPEAAEAIAALPRSYLTLTTQETVDRAAELVRRARYTEALAALSSVRPQRGALEARRLHLLGRAAYGARSRYTEAHTALSAAARLTANPDRQEDAFLAARSLARADRDDDAVRAFDAVARAQRGRWGDEAAFRAAWLEAHHDRVEQAIARFRAFLQQRTEASARLRIEASWELGWMLYAARRYPEAAEVLDRSGTMATHHLERGRGRYWAAMARFRAGDREAAARGWLDTIADRPLTWYALLAEARLRAIEAPVPPMAPPPEARPTVPVELPEEAVFLRSLGFDEEAAAALHDAEDRVRATAPSDRADEGLCLAYRSLGAARRAFQLSSRHAELLDPLPSASTRWVWDCGFPRPYAPAVEAAEDAGGMPRHYLFAIMRQESGFRREEVSSARAIGLLQMIPPTTRRVAQTLGIDFREELLFDARYNIRVGGWYIGRLYQQYHGVLPRAIGSFNAGPGAMNRWVSQWEHDELDAFVERIPFDETRNYVKRVVQNLARYRYLHSAPDDTWPLRLDLANQGLVETLVDY